MMLDGIDFHGKLALTLTLALALALTLTLTLTLTVSPLVEIASSDCNKFSSSKQQEQRRK